MKTPIKTIKSHYDDQKTEDCYLLREPSESTLTAVRRGDVCSIHGDDKRIQHGSLTVYSDTVWIHSIIMENRVTAPHGGWVSDTAEILGHNIQPHKYRQTFEIQQREKRLFNNI